MGFIRAGYNKKELNFVVLERFYMIVKNKYETMHDCSIALLFSSDCSIVLSIKNRNQALFADVLY